ncbi:hypothetical protein ARMSODRAFT_990143 [Armillaria solidipes]|uniref:CxC2-like cysteine cluster KDZ transposase-associated domain-containing protein n=1 Tax=Armillaria solidipes TaxID=1076256 RepID=A0A2H3AY29_9AGAR|nr:hypothetical protein ARMSODRAFT_990143 [Armillaria solidipes]
MVTNAQKRKWKANRYVEGDMEEEIWVPRTHVAMVSGDRRRVRQQLWHPPVAFEGDEDMDEGWETEVEMAAPELDPGGKPAAKRSIVSDRPLLEWLGYDGHTGYCDEYLQELLRLEGRGDSDLCSGGILECQRCVVERHTCLPLHIPKKWNGKYFEDVTLKSLGLRVQLGHWNMHCVNPMPGAEDFTVLHVNGIHKVAVNFCGCEHRVATRLQMLRFRWFPATVRNPRSCAMFSLLETFHAHTLAGKVSVFEYYRGLLHLTDNTEINLPKPILAIDATFCMANINKSTNTNDPGLHTGLAYFVEQQAYLKHVRKHASQKEISSCSGFRTLAQAETRNNKGLRATGVAMAVCTRHEMVVPYCNMDYVAMSALQSYEGCKHVFFSYDMACQTARATQVATQTITWHFGVPKLHCKAHKYACQCRYSMNLKQGTARTCGEGIERLWGRANNCANSMKEMGPGSRHDTIDDHFAAHNW